MRGRIGVRRVATSCRCPLHRLRVAGYRANEVFVRHFQVVLASEVLWVAKPAWPQPMDRFRLVGREVAGIAVVWLRCSGWRPMQSQATC